MKWWCLHLHGV